MQLRHAEAGTFSSRLFADEWLEFAVDEDAGLHPIGVAIAEFSQNDLLGAQSALELGYVAFLSIGERHVLRQLALARRHHLRTGVRGEAECVRIVAALAPVRRDRDYDLGTIGADVGDQALRFLATRFVLADVFQQQIVRDLEGTVVRAIARCGLVAIARAGITVVRNRAELAADAAAAELARHLLAGFIDGKLQPGLLLGALGSCLLAYGAVLQLVNPGRQGIDI